LIKSGGFLAFCIAASKAVHYEAQRMTAAPRVFIGTQLLAIDFAFSFGEKL
jgi:hypothetical protein